VKILSNTIPTSEPSKVSGVAAEKVDGSSDDEDEKAVHDEQPVQLKNHKGANKTNERSSITEESKRPKVISQYLVGQQSSSVITRAREKLSALKAPKQVEMRKRSEPRKY
jgi:hypothetical protein